MIKYMKAYGVIDEDDNELWLRTGKSSRGKLVGKNGEDTRAYIRSSSKKSNLRRNMKRTERQQAKKEIRESQYN